MANMKFITSCFIRKNTPELRKKLEELGYIQSENGAGEWHIPIEQLSWLGVNLYDSGNFMGISGHWSQDWFDCGENEDLFFALAALRKGSHKYQWHICTRSHITFQMTEYHIGDWNMCVHDKLAKYACWRKATAKEIIEHFKN